MAAASVFVIFSAFSAVLTTLIFLLIHSKLYAWYLSKIGILMNASLMFTGLAALGAITYYMGWVMLGPVISGVGWISYAVLLVWRLIELLAFKKEQEALRNNDEPFTEDNPGIN